MSSVITTWDTNNWQEKVGLSAPKTSAVVWFLDLQSDPDSFKEIRIGGSRFKRYSQKAIDRIIEAKASNDVDDIWEQFRTRSQGSRT